MTPRSRRTHRRGGRVLAPTGEHRAPASERTPQRQCIACRASRPQDALLELRDLAAAGTPGNKATSKRHAYVCVARACMTRLHKQRGPDGAPLWPDLAALARARTISMLGLARRQGILTLGAARLVEGGGGGRAPALILMATDAARRTQRALGGRARGSMLTSFELGHAAGAAPVAAVGIDGGRLALQAAYWLRVWYEARLDDAGGDTLASTPESITD